MKVIYELKDTEIKVDLVNGLIRVYSNKELWRYFNEGMWLRISELVKIIKADYYSKFDKPLNISDHSLVIEIWVHAYSHHLGDLIKKYIKIGWIQNLVQKGIVRAKVIDCGEKHLDSNRWFWDFLSVFL